MTNKLYDLIRTNKLTSATLVGFGVGLGGITISALDYYYTSPEPSENVQRIFDLEASLKTENIFRGVELSDWTVSPAKVDSTFNLARQRASELDSLYREHKVERESYLLAGEESKEDFLRSYLSFTGILVLSIIYLAVLSIRNMSRTKETQEEQTQ
ncbi:MAG: hypothetical protein Q8P81_01670 [Nanoarchaeota archaeon]|nr:hypothetical protein [Nanoarchaeota archaeon]